MQQEYGLSDGNVGKDGDKKMATSMGAADLR